MTEQQFSEYEPVNTSVNPAEDIWRNEVQDRLAHYKRRRGRRIEGAFTMRFPFPADHEPAPNQAVDTVTATAVAEAPELAPEAVGTDLPASVIPSEQSSAFLTVELIPDEAESQDFDAQSECADLILEAPVASEPEPFVDTIVRPRPKRKVIAFPKHLSVATEQVYRLADPVTSEVPRILDVPEELQAIPTTPFLDGLQFEPTSTAPDARDREHVELPFRPARTSQRVLAGIVDLVVVGLAVAVFAAVAYKILASPPLTKPLILGVAAAAVVLWSAYQYLFVVHAGKTLGMMAARMRLRNFQGKSPTLRQRRYRVLGFYLSALSLGMGLMWSFVDVDALCWHDRLSRTYLSERE
jgi:uncharacterized RDD family membrane protein YckC